MHNWVGVNGTWHAAFIDKAPANLLLIAHTTLGKQSCKCWHTLEPSRVCVMMLSAGCACKHSKHHPHQNAVVMIWLVTFPPEGRITTLNGLSQAHFKIHCTIAMLPQGLRQLRACQSTSIRSARSSRLMPETALSSTAGLLSSLRLRFACMN